jgi:aminoglycoside 6'-N-acetyltransferase I
VERFVLARGYREIGSDAELHNVQSHAAHLGWGFSETERVVYFRKALKRSGGSNAARVDKQPRQE